MHPLPLSSISSPTPLLLIWSLLPPAVVLVLTQHKRGTRDGEKHWGALSVQPCAAVPPQHAESFSGAALCGDSHTNAEATPTPPHPPLFIHYTCHIHYTWLPARQALQYKSGPENWAWISIKGLDSTAAQCENYVGQGLAGETHRICCVPSHNEPQQRHNAAGVC